MAGTWDPKWLEFEVGGWGVGGPCPEKTNILAPELFVLNFVIFWTSLEALSLRCHPTLRGGNKGLTLKNNFLHVQKIRTQKLKISSQKMTIPPPHMEGG